MVAGPAVTQSARNAAICACFAALLAYGSGCRRRVTEAPREDTLAPSAAPAAAASGAERLRPVKVERAATAMSTRLHLVAYTNDAVNEKAVAVAFDAAVREIRRLEDVLSEWKATSEVGTINRMAGSWVNVGPETLDVLEKSLWAGGISEGTFDITFQSMSGIWRFGTASEAAPRVPAPAEVARARARVDYRKVELDRAGQRVRVQQGQAIGLGGVAKGYIVDKAAAVLASAGLRSFLVQAGGDLYGAGRKPDGSRWVSGIQDPRGPQGSFFASIELEDHAFSTAGDYARSFVVNGKRYHHIIDPRTGYPATQSRSVTVWAKDALTADAIDDAVFILGAKKGLALAESLPDVGVVVVDSDNRVWTSRRLEGKLHISKAPTDGI